MKKMNKIIIIIEIIYSANRKRGSNTLKKEKKIKKKITTMIMQTNGLLHRDKEPLAAMTSSRKNINSLSSINNSMLVEAVGFKENSIIIIELLGCKCLIVRKYHKEVAQHTGIKSGETSGRHYKTLARTIVKNKMQVD